MLYEKQVYCYFIFGLMGGGVISELLLLLFFFLNLFSPISYWVAVFW